MAPPLMLGEAILKGWPSYSPGLMRGIYPGLEIKRINPVGDLCKSQIGGSPRWLSAGAAPAAPLKSRFARPVLGQPGLPKGTFAEVSVRAWSDFLLTPGRCPGLMLDRPVGAEDIPIADS